MNELDYKIVSKNQITVVTFKGRMNKDTNLQLENCKQELFSEPSQMIIMCFKEFSTIDQSAYREFTLLQQEIRKKKIELYMVGLELKVKQHLLDRAVIRNGELKKSLSEILEIKATA